MKAKKLTPTTYFKSVENIDPTNYTDEKLQAIQRKIVSAEAELKSLTSQIKDLEERKINREWDIEVREQKKRELDDEIFGLREECRQVEYKVEAEKKHLADINQSKDVQLKLLIERLSERAKDPAVIKAVFEREGTIPTISVLCEVDGAQLDKSLEELPIREKIRAQSSRSFLQTFILRRFETFIKACNTDYPKATVSDSA
jgi:chromosome segregation ATPase